jgi:oligopeptide/dipeptide ABC transporter ATP-binding protein
MTQQAVATGHQNPKPSTMQLSASGEEGAVVAPPLLEAHGLAKVFGANRIFGGRLRAQAVDDVSFTIPAAHTVGLIGESGCGKTTLGRITAGLLAPDTGDVALEGRVAIAAGRSGGREYWQKVQMVFQDAGASLSPRRTIGQILSEPLQLHLGNSRSEAASGVRSLLAHVGLEAETADRHPHQLSGGQKQRVAIARAIACRPPLVVCDEPTSALDVSVQAQILNLLLDLQAQQGLSLLFVTHDFAVAQYVSDTVMVMYAGRIVEQGPSHRVFHRPLHPYTHRLLTAVPGRWDKGVGKAKPMRAPAVTGCSYATNCMLATARCREARPALTDMGATHRVACFNHA